MEKWENHHGISPGKTAELLGTALGLEGAGQLHHWHHLCWSHWDCGDCPIDGASAQSTSHSMCIYLDLTDTSIHPSIHPTYLSTYPTLPYPTYLRTHVYTRIHIHTYTHKYTQIHTYMHSMRLCVVQSHNYIYTHTN